MAAQVNHSSLNTTNVFLFENLSAPGLQIKQEHFLEMSHDSFIYDKAFFQPLQRCSQLLTIPILQGFFEGLIDTYHMGHAYKIFLKFIPRMMLFALGYSTFLNSGMALFVSSMTDFMQEKFKHTISGKLENLLKLWFFIVVTELEYAPSKLWQLTGQLEIFPETMVLLHKLFVQMALAPAIKTRAYLASQAFMECLMAPTKELDISQQHSLSQTNQFFKAPECCTGDSIFQKNTTTFRILFNTCSE